MSKKDFSKFYNQHFNKIYRFVFFRVGAKRELAEDLTSAIFIKALEHFEDFDEEKSRSAWIFTIAHNHLVNYFRDNAKKKEISIDEMAENLETSAEEVVGFNRPELLVDGLKTILQNDTQRELLLILSKLSEDKQQLVTFKYLLGYNYAEIAEILKMTETAVKVATHRAMKELKESIKK